MAEEEITQEAYLRNHVNWMLEGCHGQDPVRKLVIAQGRAFIPAPRPTGLTRREVKWCFHNALQLARADRSLTYVEGFAAGLTVTDHAWCVTQDGMVIDPTWAEPENCAYFGVPFKTDYALDVVARNKESGRVLCWENAVIFDTEPGVYLASVAGTPPWAWVE